MTHKSTIDEMMQEIEDSNVGPTMKPEKLMRILLLNKGRCMCNDKLVVLMLELLDNLTKDVEGMTDDMAIGCILAALGQQWQATIAFLLLSGVLSDEALDSLLTAMGEGTRDLIAKGEKQFGKHTP